MRHFIKCFAEIKICLQLSGKVRWVVVVNKPLMTSGNCYIVFKADQDQSLYGLFYNLPRHQCHMDCSVVLRIFIFRPPLPDTFPPSGFLEFNSQKLGQILSKFWEYPRSQLKLLYLSRCSLPVFLSVSAFNPASSFCFLKLPRRMETLLLETTEQKYKVLSFLFSLSSTASIPWFLRFCPSSYLPVVFIMAV